jgi:hypothetical protein
MQDYERKIQNNLNEYHLLTIKVYICNSLCLKNIMKTIIIIPARYGSSRFPGKPLADIQGKP